MREPFCEKVSPKRKLKGTGISKHTGDFLCKWCKNLGRNKDGLCCLAKNEMKFTSKNWFRKRGCINYEFGVNNITFCGELEQ